MIAGALLSGGVAVAGLGLAAGTAQAAPPAHQWCPGQRMPDDGANPDGTPHLFSWDMSVCHTYYVVGYKQGNVGDYIWAQGSANGQGRLARCGSTSIGRSPSLPTNRGAVAAEAANPPAVGWRFMPPDRRNRQQLLSR
jgi:hypothetical protein